MKSRFLTNNMFNFFIVLILVLQVILLSTNSTFAASKVSRCKIAQQNLGGSIRDRDLKTRVDRAQSYQYIHQRLDIFVQRLENNSQPKAKELREQTDNLLRKINTFKYDYEAYDKARDAVSNIEDCSKDKIEFERALQRARNTRELVHQDVGDIDQLLNSPIQDTLKNLYTTLLAGAPIGAVSE